MTLLPKPQPCLTVQLLNLTTPTTRSLASPLYPHALRPRSGLFAPSKSQSPCHLAADGSDEDSDQEGYQDSDKEWFLADSVRVL